MEQVLADPWEPCFTTLTCGSVECGRTRSLKCGSEGNIANAAVATTRYSIRAKQSSTNQVNRRHIGCKHQHWQQANQQGLIQPSTSSGCTRQGPCNLGLVVAVALGDQAIERRTPILDEPLQSRCSAMLIRRYILGMEGGLGNTAVRYMQTSQIDLRCFPCHADSSMLIKSEPLLVIHLPCSNVTAS